MGTSDAPPPQQGPPPEGQPQTVGDVPLPTTTPDQSVPPSPPAAETPAAPLEQGQTAQEQATGEQSTGTPPEAPGVTPAQGDEPKPSGETDEPTFEQQQAQAAAVQSPGEPQVVPEQRPQAFTGSERISDASKRLDNQGEVPDQAAYDLADSQEAKDEAVKNSRMPNLLVGQRVEIVDGPEKGRMAYVLQVEYTDGIQAMLASSGHTEARFAEVENYIVRTRDGRSDILQLKPEEVSPLDDIDGWGRGRI